jgi:hypothetical protein
MPHSQLLFVPIVERNRRRKQPHYLPVNAGSCLPHPDLRWQPRNGHHGKSSVRGSGKGRSVKLLLKGLHWKTHCRAFRMSFILANLQNGFFSKTKNFRPLLCIAKCENC